MRAPLANAEEDDSQREFIVFHETDQEILEAKNAIVNIYM